ncbi:MAG TPA: tetratricopeptide repeat protein [Gallionella sp.]|nr:tetratricopeptide repeat protein [Gallionella sp.]
MRRIAILCLFMTVSTAAIAGFDEGLTAFNNKDYVNAIKEWESLAIQGDENAQYNLGVMYYQGIGVAKDDKQAIYWYDKAAKSGRNLNAKFNFALMHENGEGVPQDYYVALKLYKELEDSLNSLSSGFKYLPPEKASEMYKFLRKINFLLSRNSPKEFVDAKKRLDQEIANEMEAKRKAEAAIQEEESARWREKLANMDREQAAELAVVKETRANLQSKKFRQSFGTSSACLNFEKQSNALISRLEIGMSHPDEGRRFLSDIAVSFDECSRSAGFNKSKLREAYISNFNGLKLMQFVWERGVKSCIAGDNLMRSSGFEGASNCKWSEMPIQDYERYSAISELKSTVNGYGLLIEREAERRKYRNYFGPISEAASERLVKF